MKPFTRALLCAIALSSLTLFGSLSSEALAKGKKPALAFGKKGKITVAGSANFSSTSENIVAEGEAKSETQSEPTSVDLGARVGYFAWGNKLLAVEGAVELEFSRQDDSKLNAKSSTLGAFLVPTVYLKTLKRSAIFPFAQLGVGYVNLGTEEEKTESSVGGLGLKPGLGVAMAVGRAQGAFIRLQLNYEMRTLTNDDDNGFKASGFAARVGVGAFF
jgi:hypothetical protein